MNRHLIGCAAASLLATAVSIGAQEPTQRPSAAPAASPQSAAMVTVEGCLLREVDVPGRKPNIVERAGVSEDYLLTNAVVIKGTAPAAPAAKSADTPVGTSGARPAMFDVKGIDRDELKKLLGNRVQVDGTFEELEEAKPSGDSKADDSKKSEDLVDIRGTAIRLVSANCVK